MEAVGAVMISCVARRGAVRDSTLAQLHAAGVAPVVVESPPGPPSAAEVKRNAWLALSSVRGFEDGALFFEDDLVVNVERLRWFARQDVSRFDMVALCLLRSSLYPAECREAMGGTKPARLDVYALPLRAFRADRGFRGSMALWLRRDLVQRAFKQRLDFVNADGSLRSEPRHASERARRKVCGFDFWLKDYARSPAVLFPNAVDHAAEVSTMSGALSAFQSPSFRMPHA